MTEIEDFIKKNFVPVDDKPGFVWFRKRNFQIISIETLTKCLEDAWERGLYHSPLFGKYQMCKDLNGDADPIESVIANGKKSEE